MEPWLQWGRTLTGAETRIVPDERVGRKDCFNGAAPLRARKLDDISARLARVEKLQWGRTLTVAETRHRAGRIPDNPPRFNGAAPLRARKQYRSLALVLQAFYARFASGPC